MKEWYLLSDGQQSGPFSKDELVFLASQGRMSRGAQVRCGTSGEWRPAKSIVKAQPKPVRKQKRRANVPAAFGRRLAGNVREFPPTYETYVDRACNVRHEARG